METITKSTRMYSLVVLYDMHNTFFTKVLEGISDEDAHNRLNTKANHIAWIAGSMVAERFELAKQFGQSPTPVSGELFKNHQGIQDGVTYPSLEAYKKDWAAVSPVLRDVLVNMPDETLDSMFEMEGMKMSNFDLVSFMCYREANCIGQVVLWRRLLGYEPMRYDS